MLGLASQLGIPRHVGCPRHGARSRLFARLPLRVLLFPRHGEAGVPRPVANGPLPQAAAACEPIARLDDGDGDGTTASHLFSPPPACLCSGDPARAVIRCLRRTDVDKVICASPFARGSSAGRMRQLTPVGKVPTMPRETCEPPSVRSTRLVRGRSEWLVPWALGAPWGLEALAFEVEDPPPWPGTGKPCLGHRVLPGHAISQQGRHLNAANLGCWSRPPYKIAFVLVRAAQGAMRHRPPHGAG